MEHTKEPWQVGRSGYFVFSANTPVVNTNEKADANRIVACVNALAGLNPEGVRGLVDVVKAYFDMLVLICSGVGGVTDAEIRTTSDAVKAALALVERGTPC